MAKKKKTPLTWQSAANNPKIVLWTIGIIAVVFAPAMVGHLIGSTLLTLSNFIVGPVLFFGIIIFAAKKMTGIK